MDNKLRMYFDEMTVYKDLKNSNFFSSLGLPSFMRDWLLKKFEDENGQYDINELTEFVKEFIPKKSDWTRIKSRIVKDGERVRILAKISLYIDISTGQASFSLPDFGLSHRQTIIDDYVWECSKEYLVNGKEVWGLIELGYKYPDEEESGEGKIKLVSFKQFCPYTLDLDYYKEARACFTTDEWIDVLLGAIDYNANGYSCRDCKLTMLTRLLPFVEKRLNLIELAPKGTGKSYVFGRVSRYGWLSSGGVMSRAKMFYDISKGQEGLIANNDYVTLDEVQTISFTDVDEIRGALKGYMENGHYTVGTHENNADAGVILCGNIPQEVMDYDGTANMFEHLPAVFHESALIERFHGFIKGWNIPRMNDDMKICGWALNSEYFCSIMHELRDDGSYRKIVDDLVVVPAAADTRDTEAIKRIATAYLKLLFPNVRSADGINHLEFKHLCLDRAMEMRGTILMQLGILDRAEYGNRSIPPLKVRL